MALSGKLSSLFGNKQELPPRNSQALIVEVQINQISDEPMADFCEFEDQVMRTVEAAGYGEYDGNEIAVDSSHARIYMYAPNADDLLGIVAPIFLKEPVVKDASFQMRYGEADDSAASEVTLSLEQVRKIFGGE